MKKMELLNTRVCTLLIAIGLLTGTLAVVRAAAQPAHDPDAAAAMEGQFASAIVIDADTGEVLLAKEPHGRRQPASMLKMMTELIVLERVAEGDISLAEQVTVSAHASKMGGSQVYLKHNETFPVVELLKALAIHSANDAAASLAEHVAGSVEAFIDLMNSRARELGMRDTEFHSVHGLPPGRGQKPDMTSVYDMALLGRELIGHPLALEWSAQQTAPFRDGAFTLYNPNKLVGKYRGLDGLKTGYHNQSGYCVTATAIQKGKRLISVVMGSPTDAARATETTRLLSYGFTEKMQAPIEAGQEVGKGVAVLDGHVLGEVSIVTIEAVPRGNWLDRLFH
jgi:D-alanyl-D-alanine carboxypeptidase (penicillin-binding protein 5/6)